MYTYRNMANKLDSNVYKHDYGSLSTYDGWLYSALPAVKAPNKMLMTPTRDGKINIFV